ncbi:peptide-methionine (R)-S-oxide reductase [Longibacter salinarum]|uniref:peptide-methionine (R)-S-oxide reductase n=1 Tax=Longibacter salinarum TaxID=1850348 RepID=A0A2A8D208_9BACT|nr:peptide-methionine (R)-S-oxide reductase MsrB [Longibacter salinarum]PEN14853.1 peptide-methionine (R)-S-oxide reductase [Longibacter salinarum]
MDRRAFLSRIAVLAAGPTLLAACGKSQSAGVPKTAASDSTYIAPVRADSLWIHRDTFSVDRLNKAEEAWRDEVSAQAYQVLFEEATEPRNSSPLLDEDRRGTYICAACYLPLFPSVTKYESGTGWPSFWAPLPGRVGTKVDNKLAMQRTEYHCARCGGHQGHVFTDGPDPTGFRYCNNGLALSFVPEGESLPDLRS